MRRDPKCSASPTAQPPSSLAPAARSLVPGPAPGSPRRPSRALLAAAAAAGVLAAAAIVTQVAPHAQAGDRVAGAAPPKLTPGGAAVRWWSPSLSVTLDDSLLRVDPDARIAAGAAFSTWSIAGAHLPVIKTGESSRNRPGYDPDGPNANAVLFAPGGWEPAGDALAVTVATYDAETGGLVDADIVVNGLHPFALLPAGDARGEGAGDEVDVEGGGGAHPHDEPFDLQAVLTHEAGHFLGLAEDWDDRSATMYGRSAPGETHKRNLASTDVGAITELYLRAADDADAAHGAGCGGARIAPGAGGLAGARWAGLGGALVLLGAAVRRERRARVAGVAGAIALAAAASLAPARDAAARPEAPRPFDATAKVVRASSAWDEGLVQTTLVLEVTACHRDACPAGERTVRVWGGRIGDLVQTVGGAAVPEAGAEVSLAFRGGAAERFDVMARVPGGAVRALRAVTR